jgi:hypothetical protein
LSHFLLPFFFLGTPLATGVQNLLLIKIWRGRIAEVKDEGSPHNGTYAQGAIANLAIATLKGKIKEKSH